MRLMLGQEHLGKTVKTMKFLILVFFIAGIFASSVGATVGALVLSEACPSSSFRQQWLDWFVGDVSFKITHVFR